MGNVEFDGRKGVSLNVTYTALEDEDEVGIEIITKDGSLGGDFSGRTIEELHESLGVWLAQRKIRRAEKRAAARSKKQPP